MAHAKAGSAAAKRAAMRNAPEEDPEFQIAPMIDILLVLLVFFMSISSTEVLQTNDRVNLPMAKDAADKRKNVTSQSIVNVYNSELVPGKTFVELDDKPYENPAAIVPVLQERMKANPQMRVVVRADKEVRYEMTKQLLIQMGAASVQNVTFSTVDKEGAGSAKKRSQAR